MRGQADVRPSDYSPPAHLLQLHTRQTYTVIGGRCRKHFTGGGHIVSWFDLQMCSKVIEDTAIVLNTYDFLLVLNAGCISSFLRYSRFYVEMTLLGDCDL